MKTESSDAAVNAESISVPTVFDFTDFRMFLKAYYTAKKSNQPMFSYRVFSRLSKMPSPTYLHSIICGDRDIPEKRINDVAKACHLSADETSYFKALVKWNQAKSESDKDIFWGEVLRTASKDHVFDCNHSHLKLVSRWSTIAILEMIQLGDFERDPSWIQNRLRFRITASEILESIQTLIDLELVSDHDGKLAPTNKVVHIKKGFQDEVIRRSHVRLLQMGVEAVRVMKTDERDSSTTTFGIHKSDINKIRQEIREFQLKLVEQYAAHITPDEVYQLSLVLFPLTRKDSNK